MFHIKLFIKNILTNLFSTFDGQSSYRILNKVKQQRQEFTAPLKSCPDSLVPGESEGKRGGEERVPIWVFI